MIWYQMCWHFFVISALQSSAEQKEEHVKKLKNEKDKHDKGSLLYICYSVNIIIFMRLSKPDPGYS